MIDLSTVIFFNTSIFVILFGLFLKIY